MYLDSTESGAPSARAVEFPISQNGVGRSTPVQRELAAHGLGPISNDAPATELYLDLLKRTILNIIYEDPSVFYLDESQAPVLADDFSLARRVSGVDKPLLAHTMVGLKRLNNLQAVLEDVLQNNVQGDFVETGVLRGGASIFARAVFKAHGGPARRVIACDAFEAPQRAGWPLAWLIERVASIPSQRWQLRFLKLIQSLDKHKSFPDDTDMQDEFAPYMIWALQNLRAVQKAKGATVDDVRDNFARYGLLDDQVVFLKGFFSETLPGADIHQISVLRLDADAYEGTMDALTHLYPKLARGGYCIVDDYYAYRGCRRAIDEYRVENGITDAFTRIDNIAVYWQKTS